MNGSQTSAVNPMRPTPWRVAKTRRETHDTFTMTLEPQARGGEFEFTPGQFNMLYVFGVGEAPISVSGNPENPERLIHTVRAVGPVTNAMRKLRTGDAIGVRGPFGVGWPVREAHGRDIVIIAGGIGLAPLRPALYRILAHREQFGTVAILYGARSSEDILYRKELERWRARFDLEVAATVDHADASWRGAVGVVTTLISKASFDPGHTTAFVCGPEVMMRFTAQALNKRGLPSSDIYISMERNMKCAIGFCGHCQFGPHFICKDGPVYPYNELDPWLSRWEI